jgi:hypothetical protein
MAGTPVDLPPPKATGDVTAQLVNLQVSEKS